jgi:hypothetical protein
VRHHKAALLTQRTFWNSLLRDNISFKDLQVCLRPALALDRGRLEQWDAGVDNFCLCCCLWAGQCGSDGGS